MNENNQNIPVNPKIKLPVSEKLENFWYHYKWHTIITVFFVIVAVILFSQLFSKSEYDVNMIYAGEKSISNISLSGDGKTELSNLIDAIELAGKDYNNDGNVRYNLHNLVIMSKKELDEATNGMTDALNKAALESEVQNNRDTLRDLMYSGYFLYFFSEDVFKEFDGTGENQILADISKYIAEGAEYEYASERGIYLSSLPIYEATELKMLPEDTVVCIRLPGIFDGAGGSAKYETSENLLKSILAYGN